jgi:FtsH-binding integral membrane protein
MNKDIRHVLGILRDLLRISVTSGVIGAGIGFVQGLIVSRQAARAEQIGFAGVASIFGTAVAMVGGTAIYFLTKGEVSLKRFSGTVFWVIAIGSVVAFFSHNELITVFADILVAIVVTIYQL